MAPFNSVLLTMSPVLLALAAFEILWLKSKRRAYHWQDAAVSLVDMLIRQVVVFTLVSNILLRVGPVFYAHRLYTLPLRTGSDWHVMTLVLLFFGLEFFYYWFHRWSHTVRWFWATHAVHHSPNSMSFLTAERLGWTQNLSAGVLTFLPLVWLGFRPEDVLAALGINLIYQYWLHTEIIGKLGWMEGVFNTPSNHRVHHGSNPQYLDANYGGVLIIFDRIFGTYVVEEEQVIFGLVKPLMSKNPITIALHEWRAIALDASRHWRHGGRLLGYLFGPPGWSHDGSRKTSLQLKAERHLAAAPDTLPEASRGDATRLKVHGVP